MNKKTIYIILILVLALAVRLYSINSTVVGMSSWRQSDTAAMARNYAENGFNFLYPQIDWLGNLTGYVETEFPIYQYMVAILYKFSGISEHWGRLLSILFSLITLFYFYRLVEKITDESTALWSVFFLSLLPFYMFYSRAFMPESLLIMSMVLSMYFFHEWLSAEKVHFFMLACFFTALAVLIKIYPLFIGLPLFYLAWLKFGRKVFLQKSLWFYCFLVIMPAALWYLHAHRTAVEYSPGLTIIWDAGSGKWLNWDLIASLEYWDRILIDRLANKHFTYVGFMLFVAGLFLKRNSKHEKLFDFWLLSVVIYFVIVGKGNFIHGYYQLYFVVPASVFIGKMYARFFKRSALTSRNSILLMLCLIVFLFLVENQYYHIIKKERNYDKSADQIELAKMVNEHTKRNALIIAVDNGNPVILYLCHRKGWHADPDNLEPGFFSEKVDKGAQYLVGIKSYFKTAAHQQKLKEFLSHAHVKFNNERLFIVEFQETPG